MISSALYGLLHSQARMRAMNPETYSAEVTLIILFAALVLSLVTAGALGVWSIMVTHRICGPLYVLENCFRTLASGKFPTRRALRKKDEFKGLHDAFWEALNAVKATKQSELEGLEAAVAVARSGAKGDQQQQKKTLHSLAAQLEEMRQEIARSLGEPECGTCGEEQDEGQADSAWTSGLEKLSV